eukprot:TRINITY_DN3020_c0_g1_i1.p1 TRINITY_DN3020_c0_g1~~TRINITY_DN3020_c0_g1_i1.p1  ORF type:complete len:442 (+),score=134.66 TRINITY_DN3020_c0_g1_i1:166-1326(+)
MPEEMIKKMLDAKNVICVTVTENSDGSFTSISEQSMAPELNSNNTFKIGETTKVAKPWPMVATVTKTNETTWQNRVVMGDKTMVSDSTVNNYGMTICGTIEGTALSFREEFKRVSPKVTGFYVFESEKGLNDVMKMIWPQFDLAEFEKLKPNLAYRIVEECGGVCIDERLGDVKKVLSVKFDEEYDYVNAAWNVEDKRITTKLGPGCIKTVCKGKKDGKTWEFTLNFNDWGFSCTVKSGGLEATECYKRVPDVEGTWRMVSHCGMENYLSAFGITGDLAAEMITGSCSEYFTLERLSGGKFKSLTNSKWFPSEMIAKFGETYTMEIAGFGNVEGVMTELKDTILNVMKFKGKIIKITEKISGDFMVVESVVNGSAASTMKTIFARD